MPSLLFIQLTISFLIGGLFIALQTFVTERAPPRWRGIILSIPSTMGLGLLFIGLTKTPQDAARAVTGIPAILGTDYVFITIFAFLIRFGFLASLLGSFLALALMISLISYAPPRTFLEAIFLYDLPLTAAAYFAILKLASDFRLNVFPVNAKHLLLRSLFGGAVVALTVLLAKTVSNFWGGVFSAFPAAFISALVIFYHLQGKACIPALVRSKFLPGSLGFVLYAGTAVLAFPAFGVWMGTLAAYAATLLFLYGAVAAKKLHLEFGA